MLPLTEHQLYHTAIQVYRAVNNYSPSYLLNVFSKDVTGYCGHNANHLTIATNFGKRSSFIVEQVYGIVYLQMK